MIRSSAGLAGPTLARRTTACAVLALAVALVVQAVRACQCVASRARQHPAGVVILRAKHGVVILRAKHERR